MSSDPNTIAIDPAELLAQARAWGLHQGRVMASQDDIRAAAKSDPASVDWLEWPDGLWSALSIDLLSLVATIEDVARETAREEGERVLRELTPDELRALIKAEDPWVMAMEEARPSDPGVPT